jgi:SAM-dependent methyltransferase
MAGERVRGGRLEVSCPICAADADFQTSVNGYQLQRCTSHACSHVFVDPRPSLDELIRLYDTTNSGLLNSDSWTLAQDYEAAPDVIKQHYRNIRIDWLTQRGYLKGHDTAVLDVGCSTGIFLRVLADEGFTAVHGLDLSRAHREFVQQRHRIPCAGSFAELPDAQFDLVTCYAVLEHTLDPLQFLRDARRILKPGGCVVLLVPNYQSWYRMIAREQWIWLVPPVHLQYFTPASLVLSVRRAGLDDVECVSTYSGTSTYLIVHHLMRVLRRSMPSTRRSGRTAMQPMINGIETLLHLGFFPISRMAARRDRHNELICVASRPS